MITIRDIAGALEELAPAGLQESYDNIGLLAGEPEAAVKGILVCLDVTPEVLEEAERLGCNAVVSHHPPFFTGMKRFAGGSLQERILVRSIRSGISLIACHTNLDSVKGGVSGRMAAMLGLVNCSVLVPRENDLVKLVCFIPESYAEQVGEAIFGAGGGTIGKYDSCSFQASGTGTFRAGEGANPFVGSVGMVHREPEIRFETVFPRHLTAKVTRAMIAAHPYEEVAYDLYPLLNTNPAFGLGIAGDLPDPCGEEDFLRIIRHLFGVPAIRHSALRGKPVRRVAVCGGSGAGFIRKAGESGADFYLSADIKYHEWSDLPEGLVVADIGHFESERFAINVLAEYLIEKFPTFAVHLTEVNTNPINYSL